MMTLPSIPEATAMEFKVLAPLLTHFIEDSRVTLMPQELQERYASLVDVLASKVPKCPTPPQLNTYTPPIDLHKLSIANDMSFSLVSPPVQKRLRRIRKAENQKLRDSLSLVLQNKTSLKLSDFLQRLESSLKQAERQPPPNCYGQENQQFVIYLRELFLQFSNYLDQLKPKLDTLKIEHRVWQQHQRSNGELKQVYQQQKTIWTNKNEIKQRVVDRLRSINRVTTASLTVHKLPWKLLPAGIDILKQITGHFRKFCIRNPNCVIDDERISFAIQLEPISAFVGMDEFDGYVAFTYSETDKVLLENPVYGNAAYILGGNWKELSRICRLELISHRNAYRVIHRPDSNWKLHIRYALFNQH
jgi:hypothetical protein